MERGAQDTVAIYHPEEDQSAHQWGHDHRQKRDKNGRAFKDFRKVVHADRDGETENDHEGRHDEGIGQREGKRPVEGQVQQGREKGPDAVRAAPSFADFSKGQMRAVCIGAKTVKPAKRLFFHQFVCGLDIHGGDRVTAKGAAAFGDDEHLLVLDIERLDRNRDNGKRDEQDHRRERRQDKPKEGAVFHGIRLGCEKGIGGPGSSGPPRSD